MDDQETESIWPALLSGHRLDDGIFARAYESIPPGRRALLKSCIAALYAACSGSLARERLLREDYGPAGSVLVREIPVAWTLVVIDRAFASCSKLLAACLPALCARVPRVAVLRIGDETAPGADWPPALALALELAGVEDVFDAPSPCAEDVCAELETRLGAGLAIDLCATPLTLRARSHCDVHRPRAGGGMALFAPEDFPFDCEALAFAHGGRSVDAYGRPPAHPLLAPKAGGFEAMLAGNYDALYVPASLAERALGAAPLVLTPGGEAYWLWPDLRRDRFLRRFAALIPVSPPDLPERP